MVRIWKRGGDGDLQNPRYKEPCVKILSWGLTAMIVNDSFNKHDCVTKYYYQLSSLTIVPVGTRHLETKYQIFMPERNAQKLDLQYSSQMFTRL